MIVKFHCSNCGNVVRAKEVARGKFGRCKHCNAKVQVPVMPSTAGAARRPAASRVSASAVGATASVAAPQQAVSGDDRHFTTPDEAAAISGDDFLASIRYPFTHRNWIARLWWVPTIAMFLPLVSNFVLRGWRMQIVCRIGRDGKRDLPTADTIGNILLNGLLLTFMRWLYWVPLGILLFFFGSDLIAVGLALVTWLYEAIFRDQHSQTLSDIWGAYQLSLVVESALPIAYLLVVWPIYRAGMIRYALTGHASVFFGFLASAKLLAKLPSDFILVFVFWMLMRIVLIPAGVVAMATVIASPLVTIVIVPMHFWMTGYFYGRLAERARPLLS